MEQEFLIRELSAVMINTNRVINTNRKRKVLIVDDEQDFLTIMDFFLTSEGFEVETVGDGDEALEAAKLLRPDLILLDVIMPRMDGLSALKELREEADTMNIPVIMLSIIEEPESETDLLNISDYLVKPFSPDDLIEKIHQTLEV
jgi:DNA-binding response OmpR family regulator